MRFLRLTAALFAMALLIADAAASPPPATAAQPRMLNSVPAEAAPSGAATDAGSPYAPAGEAGRPRAAAGEVGQAAQPAVATSPVAAVPKTADAPPPVNDNKSVAARAPKPPAPPTLVARIDLSRQTMTVAANGKTLHTWSISSGRAGYETPTGSFRPSRAEEMWYSTQYDDAPMPHSVFFNGGIATHGTQATRRLGSPASHGCVRLAPRNAERFYDLVHQHGLRRTRVVVTGKTPASSAPAVARRQKRDRYAGRYYDDDRPRGPRRRIYVDRYGYAPAPYYAQPPRLIYPGDGPRYRNGW